MSAKQRGNTMNVFYTQTDPIHAAQDHCKKHRNKMIVEYAQVLSAAHHVLDDQPIAGIYKLTHKNHPSAVWVRESKQHYDWVLTCALELCRLYTLDTGKTHKTQTILELLQTKPRNLTTTGFDAPPKCMDDEFKTIANTCQAYQSYLCSKFREWQQRAKPIKVEFFGDVPEWVN